MDLLEKINRRIYLPGLLLIFLIAIGFFFRIYKLDKQSFWIDEGFTYMQMEAVRAHGYPLLDSGVIDIKDILLPYILQIARMFGTDPFVVRFLPALFGAAAIYVVFLLARYLWDRTVGMFAAFLLTFSYWHIAWSRQLRPYTLLVLLIFATFLALFFYEKTNQKKHLFWALAWIAGATLAKSAGILLLLPFIGYLFLKKHYLFGSAGLILLASGVFVFWTKIVETLGAMQFNYLGYYTAGYLWQYFGIMFFLAIVGWLLAIKNEKSNWRIHFVTGIFFVVTVAFFSFLVYVNQRRYLFFITPLLFMYSAYALALIAQSRKKYVVVIIAMLFFDAFTTRTLIFWPKSSFLLEDYTPQPNFNKAYREIKTDWKDSHCIISPYPYLDRIYLGRSTWALPISYTGREQDSTGQLKNEHYSGTKILYQRKTPNEVYLTDVINNCEATYFVIDAMSQSRLSPKMMAYLTKYGRIILKDDVFPPQAVWVYRIDAKAIGGIRNDGIPGNEF